MKNQNSISVRLLIAIALLFIVTGLITTPLSEVVIGIQRILTSPSLLITDYFLIGNVGAAFVNAGVMMGIGLFLVLMTQTPMSGSVVAALLTIAGFSFFGKNGFNVWPLFLGVASYAWYRKESLSKVMVIALFASAFSPLVSQIAYGFDLPLVVAIPLSYVMGIAAGFLFVPLARHFVTFHQGYNLYNVGFTAGIIGMVFMALMRSFGYDNDPILQVATGITWTIELFLAALLILLIGVGIAMTKGRWQGLSVLMKSPGKLGTDYWIEHGVGITLINMALMGSIALAYVVLVDAELNGPVLGGILTVIGFGAIGKHPLNSIPIMAGVYLATLLNIWDPHAPTSVLAALFGTTLAPIAGSFGPLAGVVAGFLHMLIVMNVGVLHGGMNLYNNGFAGGFVAAFCVPIIESLRRNTPNKK